MSGHPKGTLTCRDCRQSFIVDGLHPRARYCPACRGNHPGGRPRRYAWTPEREAVLCDQYDGGIRNRARTIARAIGFPVLEVWRHASRLGLSRPRSRDWTPEEDVFLAQWTGRRASSWIARCLGRSLASVAVRQKRIGLQRRVRDGYSLQDLCAVLGRDHHTVERWFRLGWLSAARRPRQGPQGDYYRVQEADLVAFIRAHPECVDLRRVDQVWFHDVVVRAVAVATVAQAMSPSRDAVADLRRLLHELDPGETCTTVELHARTSRPAHQVRLALRVLQETGELQRVWRKPAAAVAARAS